MTKRKINRDNDYFDYYEEYFKDINESSIEEFEEYFPQKESKPPHY